MKFRTYHEVTGSDASAIGPQVSRQQQRIEERLARVGLLVGVMSGKGGVGKTYVTAGLALAFGERGLRVGVLDADLAAPTAARVLGASGPVAVDEEGVRPATGRGGIRVFSTDLLLEALAWWTILAANLLAALAMLGYLLREHRVAWRAFLSES